jgi:hypothetical protein
MFTVDLRYVKTVHSKGLARHGMTRNREANLPKVQEILRFVLQVLHAENIKIFQMKQTTASALKTQGTNGVEPQCVCSPLSLTNSKDLWQNKPDHIQLYRLHYLQKKSRREAIRKTANIQQNTFLGSNE